MDRRMGYDVGDLNLDILNPSSSRALRDSLRLEARVSSFREEINDTTLLLLPLERYRLILALDWRLLAFEVDVRVTLVLPSLPPVERCLTRLC